MFYIMAVNNNKTIFREYNKQQHQQQTWQLHSKKILSINIYYVTYVCVWACMCMFLFMWWCSVPTQWHFLRVYRYLVRTYKYIRHHYYSNKPSYWNRQAHFVKYKWMAGYEFTVSSTLTYMCVCVGVYLRMYLCVWASTRLSVYTCAAYIIIHLWIMCVMA